MKNLTLVLTFVFLTMSIAEAQVKRQYRNANSSKTVMVVKEDKAQQSDIDILNSQFNLDEVSMGDEVMITTEQWEAMNRKTAEAEVPSVPEAPATTAEAPIAKPARVVKASTPKAATIAEAKPITQRVSKPRTTAKTSTAAATSRTSTATAPAKRVTHRSSGDSANRASFTRVKKSKRVRLKKRKNIAKRKFSACYRF